MKIWRIKLLLAVITVPIILFPLAGHAFSINPAKFLVNIGRGEEQMLKLTVYNSAKKNTVYLLDVVGAKQDENGRPKFGKGIDEAESWVKIESPFLAIAPGAKKTALFAIKAPANASAGESHYLGLTVTPVIDKTSGIGVAGQAASLAEIVVAGTVFESVLIKEWQLITRATNKLKWRFNLQLENTGTVAAPLSGKMLIKNWRGKIIGERSIYLGNKLVARAARTLKPEIIISNSLWPGFYWAELAVSYGRTGRLITAFAPVGYFPVWSLAIGLAFILFLLSIMAWRIVSKRKK